MFVVIVILAIIICVVLAFFILIQNPKGGGLSGTFGGAANQLFGYSRSSDSIEKYTWYMIVAIFVLCLSSAAFKPAETQETVPGLKGSEAQGPTTVQTPTEPTLEQQPAGDGAVQDESEVQLPTE
jgi:preprotein translocase subunit SecG